MDRYWSPVPSGIRRLPPPHVDSSELQQQLRTHQGFAPLLALDVDARAVATVVADWTGIPLSSLLRDEQSDLLSME
ncbi:hypothetical protein, partial [Pseudomonas aeruginosa]|uniref:hypothetical protein n=1 Tax=Pseudomonas aeruginosa TaxID=287 RepID=UPI003D18D8BA